MRELKFKIIDKVGLHARPAGAISAGAKCFKCNIEVECDGKMADAKRLLSLMSLGATSGKILTFKFDGEDEDKAYLAIEMILNEKLGK